MTVDGNDMWDKEPTRMYTQVDMDKMISLQRMLAWKMAVYQSNSKLREIDNSDIDKIIEDTKRSLREIGIEI